MGDMTACLNDLSYIPPNNEQNEPTQGDIGETSNELTQAIRNEFEELYVSANEDLYPGCNYVTRLDFMAKFTYFKVKGLVADGFNPFDNLSQSYSMWPVILTTYNLPLWSLIDDLKDLWAKKGVETIDVAIGHKFNMRAMVLWTINDFSARNSLSGWSGQGYNSCLTCNEDTPSTHRDPLRKFDQDEILAQLARLLTRVKGKHPRSVCKSIGLRSLIRIDHQELKKVIWYVLHNNPEIDTYQAKFKSRDERHKTQNSGICSAGEDGEMYYEDDPDVIHFDNSSDLALSTSLNDLDFASLHIDGQSMDVGAPPDFIDVDEDDDIIDDKDAIPYDLADYDDEDLVNVVVDDDGVVATVAAARAPEYPTWEAGKSAGCIPARKPGIKDKYKLGQGKGIWIMNSDQQSSGIIRITWLSFHHLDDAKDIWLAVKAMSYGGNEESKKNEEVQCSKPGVWQTFHKKSNLIKDFKISESEGLHKGYDRFQKVLSQLNQMQARPDNEDCNMKFLRALPPSWSQVAITLKTKGGLDFLSFDDLYNKLRTLEIDVKGGSSYDSRVPAAPTHSAFISAASTNSKWSTADSKCQPSSVSYTTTSSSADAIRNITYEDFDQIGKLDLEELDIKWQMAMLSVRINRFEKKAGRKFKFNNKDAARYRKGWIQDKVYLNFKIKEMDKSEEPKALVSVDSMLNWSDHESEDIGEKVSKVYVKISDRDEAVNDPVPDGVSVAAGVKPLLSGFVKPVGMHAVPPPITGTFMPLSNKPDIDDTQFTYGSKSNNGVETNYVPNDFVSCDYSDKFSDSESTGFASCVSSVKSSSLKTKDQLPSASSSVDLKNLHKTDDQGPSNDTPQTYRGNRPTSVFLACRPFPAGWHNPAARPMTRPKSHYFQQFSMPGSYNQKTIRDGGRWGTFVTPQQLFLANNRPKSIGDPITMVDLKIYRDNPHTNKDLDKECLVLSKEFQLPDSSQVVLRVPRRHNLYCFNLTDIHSEKEIKCLLAKASLNESTQWHRRMAHVNFKNMNMLAKHGLVNGLPSKLFTNEHNCVACNKGKQHKASYKAITAVSTISEPLQLLHMDLFVLLTIRNIRSQALFLVPNVSTASATVESTSAYAEELARLQGQAYAANSAAKDTWKTADTIEGIHHHPTTAIFSESTYNADFGGSFTNLAPTIAVDPVPTRRVHTVHPISQIIGDITSPVLTRGTLKKSKLFGRECSCRLVVAQALNDPDWVRSYAGGDAHLLNQDVWKLITFARRGKTRGTIDKTLFIKKNSRDIILVQVYVDDIIYGSTKKAWCDEFEVLMKGEFKMSAMGELTFFLGLQVKQKPDGIFISQDKYVQDMLKKFDMESVRTATTPYEASKPKSKDEPDEAVNVHLYRSMIGSLMYLTASRPDIMFAVCNTPKIGSQRNVFPGALLHDPIAQV
ncbi:ribonuclease H-like domain-containing protein, partial [Tanacetum coccineum]